MNPSRNPPGQPFPPIRLFTEVEPAKKSAWRQFCSEPFRPFFLLGWVLSLIALGVWPLFFMGGIDRYPGPTHAYLMIQGFFGAFAIGFLWTALPRMLEVPGPSRRWLFAGISLTGGGTLLHLAGFHPMGHLLFLALVGLVLAFGVSRFPARRDLPPPSFVLVAAGMLVGLAGTTLVAAGETGWISGFGYRLGRLFLTEIFLLFLVMGVAAFLAPRFLGKSSRQSFPTTRTPDSKWKRQAALAGGTAALILTGSFLHAAEAIRAGAFLIALPMTAYILYQVPVWSFQKCENWMAIGMRLSLGCSLTGPWARVIFPDARIASIHLLLLGGFGLLTLIVGTRVTFGHSGYGHLFRTPMKSFGLIVALYMGSLITRLSGEVFISAWTLLLTTSALLLLAAHLAWGVLVIPKILRPRQEDAETTNFAQVPTIRAARPRPQYGSMAACGRTETHVHPTAQAK